MDDKAAVDLSVTIGPLELKNPVIAASGTFGYGLEYQSIVDLNLLGAIVVKGTSLAPKDGNPPPRIVETLSGMLNAIGLANIGVQAFIEEKLPLLRDLDTKIIVNIYGQRVEEYGELAAALKGVDGVDALEVNISCPNVDCGGMAFGTDPRISREVTRKVLEKTDKPVIVKLTPNVTDIRPIAMAVEEAGAHAISLINTLRGMAIDIETRRPVLANITGGLSGPAIKPVALHMVYQAAKAVNIPVIGGGGIADHRDALEFLIAGARAIEVGTTNFANPRATIDIMEGLRGFCSAQGISSIKEIIGSLKTG
ncbi:MAG: dihydroorotate dehydrogenase [Deltaproteobacteria bacterium]|nr:dihydroorotate dehydrogenase [Deltaproteobacteria bacterium]MBW2137986.1 dihydroorotate dehydrogenase [Deltaproteobacteria bacterium]